MRLKSNISAFDFEMVPIHIVLVSMPKKKTIHIIYSNSGKVFAY